MKREQTFHDNLAAVTTEQTFTPVFVDQSQAFRVCNVWSSLVTAGITLTVRYEGKVMASIDCARFAAGNHPVPLEFDTDPQNVPTYSYTDLAGGAHNNVATMFVYDLK